MTGQIIDEAHAGYVVTVDREDDPRRPPPRILSRSELPTDAELSAVHEQIEKVLEVES